VPKQKAKRNPEKYPQLIASNVTKSFPHTAEDSSPQENMDQPDEIDTLASSTEPFMYFICGVDSDHAASCGNPCPNGVTDCPEGQFCFLLECESPISIESPIPAESWACGYSYNHAASCESSCPIGVTDCPLGQFCFQVECEPDGNADVVDGPTLTEYPTESSSELSNYNPYQCGVTRDEAIKCSEACDESWKCPVGKKCYNVPC
jgi:hypothetical protein